MANEEDRISSLPDRLLLQIISRIKIKTMNEEERLMSTKEVIKTTTTISKRWRYLWTRLPTLVFIDDDVIINGRGWNDKRLNDYNLFIDQTLAQRPTDVNLTSFKLEILDLDAPGLQLNRWIHYAITRDVQEIDLRITDTFQNHSCDDALFFNNSCLISMQVLGCAFNPPNGAIRWDKLKFLRIEEGGGLNEDLIGKIFSGSPCLETLELNRCNLDGRIAKSLFGNRGVLERLSCDVKTYKRINDNRKKLFSDSFISMKLSRCTVVNPPPKRVIRLDNLKFLCIDGGELDEDAIGNILSKSPILETSQLNGCCGFRRIDVTSKSVKNLVLSRYGYSRAYMKNYTSTLEINAPYILTLTIQRKMYLEKLLLENVSSLVKAHLNYRVTFRFADSLRRCQDDIQEELLQELLWPCQRDCTWI